MKRKEKEKKENINIDLAILKVMTLPFSYVSLS